MASIDDGKVDLEILRNASEALRKLLSAFLPIIPAFSKRRKKSAGR